MRWSGGVRNAESRGYFLGTVLAPLLIAAFIVWLINRGRKVKLTSAQKQLLAALLALGMTLLSSAGSLQRPSGFDASSAKRRMGHLLKEAAGKETATSDSEWYEGPTREFFRDILKFNQEYAGVIQSVDRSSMAKLYAPESYATRAGMRTTASQLHALLDVDKKYESLDPLIKSLEAGVAATTASETQKAEFLKGFRGSFNKSLGPRNETFRAEEEWLQSSIDLYEYTLSHFADYTVRGKKLMFRSEVPRVKFQDLQTRAIALHKTATNAKQKLDAATGHAASEIGISPADISSPASKEN